MRPSISPSVLVSSWYEERITTAVIGIPLKAVEKAALARTPAANTFQRWLGRLTGSAGREKQSEEFMPRSVLAPNHFENQIILNQPS